ncbi:hypothetical protein Y032_0264g628 [Ancylostoma ceylanicum]|uniref:Uncharacterized protein n=1 Tax=Ancylostoma ceylanicum TaxID=53326 RepID=A0A016S9Q0_9BILA|nr:hypothetical protein Y032_0264g628 [Ancylostoma ceylanicum]
MFAHFRRFLSLKTLLRLRKETKSFTQRDVLNSFRVHSALLAMVFTLATWNLKNKGWLFSPKCKARTSSILFRQRDLLILSSQIAMQDRIPVDRSGPSCRLSDCRMS